MLNCGGEGSSVRKGWYIILHGLALRKVKHIRVVRFDGDSIRQPIIGATMLDLEPFP